VKVWGIIAIAVILAVVIVIVTGVGGPHGPSRHMSGNTAADRTASGGGPE
jgi:hypothetical protein